MKKTRIQVREEIEALIDELELGLFKERLLDELCFNYRLDSFEEEDYSELGNTRFGGFPDLPKDVEYPHTPEGYYSFLCQINFSDFEDQLDKLPKSGIVYVFDGYSGEGDSVVLFSKSTDNLEKKLPPKGLECLYPYPKDSIKVSFEMRHYFDGIRFGTLMIRVKKSMKHWWQQVRNSKHNLFQIQGME